MEELSRDWRESMTLSSRNPHLGQRIVVGGRTNTPLVVASTLSAEKFQFSNPRYRAAFLSRREFELRFVLFGGEDEMGGEFVSALGNKIFDQMGAAFGQEFFNLVGGDLVFAEFLDELEHGAVVLVRFADVIRVFHFDELTALVRFALTEHLRF